jgi:hypothetical protein
MSKQLITINALARRCGYFNSDTNVNNGYGCDHPNQEQTDLDENGEEQGKCYSFSCPIAYEADYEDLQKLDPDLAEEYKDDKLPDGTIESDWVVWERDKQ